MTATVAAAWSTCAAQACSDSPDRSAEWMRWVAWFGQLISHMWISSGCGGGAGCPAPVPSDLDPLAGGGDRQLVDPDGGGVVVAFAGPVFDLGLGGDDGLLVPVALGGAGLGAGASGVAAVLDEVLVAFDLVLGGGLRHLSVLLGGSLCCTYSM